MKLLYVILAHDRPDNLEELARLLVARSTDARVLIHFDQRADSDTFARLEDAVAPLERVDLVRERVATGWGSFGLVESVVNALAQAEGDGIAPDYVTLLSGADLPVRPLAEFERFLEENKGREFIEDYDESWMIAGLRKDRYRYHFPFDAKKHPRLVHWFLVLQRVLRLRRRFPSGLVPRFGSQWWTLSWPTCQAILGYIRDHPSHWRFFRTVWIPDEMVFQTMVHKLVGNSQITGYSLTHYQFTDKGKPVVFEDDHKDYVLTLDKFFVRKCNPRARELRARCLERGAEADAGQTLPTPASRQLDYRLKVQAQIAYPRPGQIFYRDQYNDMTEQMVARIETRHVLVFGTPEVVWKVGRALDGGQFQLVGDVFAPDKIEFSTPDDTFQGLSGTDIAIRDLHPTLYLYRVLERCERIPVLLWAQQGSHRTLFENLLWLPGSVPVACLPFAGSSQNDEIAAMATSPTGQKVLAAAQKLPNNTSPEVTVKTILGEFRVLASEAGFVNWSLQMRNKLVQHLSQNSYKRNNKSQPIPVSQTTLRDVDHGLDEAPFVHMPWVPWSRSMAVRPKQVFEASLAAASSRDTEWFKEFADRLRKVGEEEIWPSGPKVLSDRARSLLAEIARSMDLLEAEGDRTATADDGSGKDDSGIGKAATGDKTVPERSANS